LLRRSLVCLFVLVLPVPVGAQDDDAETIRILRSKSNEAIERHDVPGILSFLDDEFHATGGAGGMIDGVEAMGAAFAQEFESYDEIVYVRTPESVEVSVSGRAAAEAGRWVGTGVAEDRPFRGGGYYSAYWRKRGSSWVIRSELFVTLYCEGSGCP
jgi:ketosteroid isomerase-like protein